MTPSTTLLGTYTALTTPFADGQVDFARLTEQLNFQMEAGVDGVVPCGTTGESPTLSHEEHGQVIEHTVKTVDGRAKVIAGTGSNSTTEAIDLTRHAKEVGADMALLVNPYYNKPTQEGLYQHFMKIADKVEIPICLYNIPGRTGIKMEPATVARLAEHEMIVAIKEATGELDMASEIASLTDPAEFAIISGDDSLTLPLMSVGGSGVISVLSNLLPDKVKTMVEAARGGRLADAQAMHLQLFPLFKAMFLETNPIPIKTAMAIMGRDSGELRLPLCEMEQDTRTQLESVLRQVGVLA